MSVMTFAAIYIGSYEVSLKVFELSGKKSIRTIDFVRSRVELGKDAYLNETIGYELLEKLCNVLNEFKQIMDGYKVDDYRMFAGPILKSVTNDLFVADQIKRRTGLEFAMLSNSEHRFLSYKCVSSKPEFSRMIQESAAVVNVGGGELQITLFVHGEVLTTQHLVLGTMRIAQMFRKMDASRASVTKHMRELIDKEMEVFKSQYYQNRTIKYLILTGDYSLELMRRMEKNMDGTTVDAAKFQKFMEKLEKKDTASIADVLNISNDTDILLLPSLILYGKIMETLSADSVWVPGVDISDGIVYDYALENHYAKPVHDFERDVLSAARSLSKRYMSYSPHIDALVEMSTLIYDSMKKIHGYGKHERLLLQTAAILHDCGKYVSFANAPQCAYDIIIASEIMGLSHRDRVIVASIVKYNTYPLDSYEKIADTLDEEAYLIVAKCASILRVANAMDRSHKQKFRNVRVTPKERQLLINIETDDSIALEKILFDAKASMFIDVFGIKPVIKEKKVMSL
ncbi:MAG: HD domain-containing protein [bacterium]|nr:HD domain-containing protein [bacterium]